MREILKHSYWEHYKRAKELALILPLKHPKRVSLERELNKISKKLEWE